MGNVRNHCRTYVVLIQVPIKMDEMEHKSADFVKNVNPFGKLPVISMANGKPLIESGAQLSYLADVFDPNVNTAEERAIVSQWCMFANARYIRAWVGIMCATVSFTQFYSPIPLLFPLLIHTQPGPRHLR